MSKADDFYEEAMKDWEVRQRGKTQLIGFRDDMRDIERWKSYCLTYKPIRYGKYLALRVRANNGEIPHLP